MVIIHQWRTYHHFNSRPGTFMFAVRVYAIVRAIHRTCYYLLSSHRTKTIATTHQIQL